MKRDRKGWRKRGSDGGGEPAGVGGTVSAGWVWSGLDEKCLQSNKHVKEYTILGDPGQENQAVSIDLQYMCVYIYLYVFYLEVSCETCSLSELLRLCCGARLALTPLTRSKRRGIVAEFLLLCVTRTT